MDRSSGACAVSTVEQLRRRAARHREVALSLTSTEDARLAMVEADLADRTADQIDAELAGRLVGFVPAMPLYKQI